MGKKENLAKNTLILSIGTFLPKLAGFFTLPILTEFLTKPEYSNYNLITLMVSLYLPELTLQVKTAAFRFLLDCRDDPKQQKRIVSNIYAVTVPISFLALILLYFILPLILPGVTTPVMLFICGYYLADIFVNTARQVSRGIGKNLPYSVSATISAAGKMLFAILLVRGCKMGLLGATIALCMASFFSLIYISLRIKIWKFIDPRLISKQMLKELIGYSWPMVPNDMSMWVMNASDQFIVTRLLGASVNAVYAAATKIPSLINLAQTTLTLAWTENASVSAKDPDSDGYYTEMMRVMLNLQAGVFSIVMGTMPILFRILIKGSYEDAYVQMPILCYAIFFQGVALYLGGIYVAKKATKNVGVTSLCAAIINITVNLLLIRKIGIFAASISTLVSYIALFTYRIFHVQKLAKVRMSIKQFGMLHVIMLTEVFLSYQPGIAFKVVNGVLGAAVCVLLNRDLVRALLRKAGGIMQRVMLKIGRK